MSEEQASQCPNCEKLWERIKKLEAEKEKSKKLQIVLMAIVCFWCGVSLLGLLIAIAAG